MNSITEEEAHDIVDACIGDGEATFGKMQTFSWGVIVDVDIEQVSEDASEVFSGTERTANTCLGVDGDFVDQNLLMVELIDDADRKLYAHGHHTMPENNDESYNAYFHGHIAIPFDGGRHEAHQAIWDGHQKAIAAAAEERLQEALELMQGVTDATLSAVASSDTARRLMRLIAGTA